MPPSARISMATLAPTRNASPTVWRMSTVGKAQNVVASRSHTLSGKPSIQRKNGSMRDRCYPDEQAETPGLSKKDEPVTRRSDGLFRDSSERDALPVGYD